MGDSGPDALLLALPRRVSVDVDDTALGYADAAGPKAAATAERPTWTSVGDIPKVVFHRRSLCRTVLVALVVGTALFCINQLDVVLKGKATHGTWVKAATTYFVPFFVANYGVITASHRPRQQ
jgi:hypothetical protein